MTPSIRLVLLALVTSAVSNSLTYAEDVIAELRQARDTYEVELQAAQRLISDRYRVLISESLDKGDGIRAEAYRAQKDVFEKQGIVIGRAEMQEAIIAYGTRKNSGADRLAEAYKKAAATLRKTGEQETADTVQSELIELRLPTRLNSIKRLQSNSYIQHGDYEGSNARVTSVEEKINATFELVAGLSDVRYVSFRSVNVPNHYLVHGNLRIQLQKDNNSETFRENATFKMVEGLGSVTAISFESVNYPRHFIRARKTPTTQRKKAAADYRELWCDEFDGSPEFKGDATFVIDQP